MATHRRTSVKEEPVTSVLSRNEVVYDPEDPDKEYDADEQVLAALGYKPEFKREFSLWSTFAVSFSVLGLLPSFASTLYYGMGYAGTAGMTWGWLVAMIGIQCVALSMAEICSSMPTSGGLYYASAVLAPPGWGPLAAWITGWSNWLGQVTAAPSVNYGICSMILAAASIANPKYVPQDYQVFLLTCFMMIIHCFLSSMPTKFLARFNSVGTVLNMAALIAVIIMIPAATSRPEQGLPRFAPSNVVWGTVYQGTEWPNGIAVLMSFLGIIWTLSGYDSPFHIAEECSNANIASPRAIVLTSTVGGTFGWFLQLVVAYTVIDISAVLDDPSGQPWAAYLRQAMPYNFAMAILSLTIVAGFFMGQACMIAASRVTFAYARDDCFPFSRYLKHINTKTKTPVNAVIANGIIGIILLCLIFGGEYAAGALFSIGAIAQYIAFTIPIFIRLFMVGSRFRPGPWNLGRLTIPIGSTACAFVILMVPIMCFPADRGADLDLTGMNWTALVYGGPMALVLLWWFVSARKWFKGPKVNVEHMMFGREGMVQITGLDHKHERDNDATSSSGSDGIPRIEKPGLEGYQ